MGNDSLFTDSEVAATSSPTRKTGMRERLLDTYAQELLAHPPVRSLDPTHEPDERRRIGESRRLAGKDLNRFYKCVTESGLEIGEAGRIAQMKHYLKLCLGDSISSDLAEEIGAYLGESS